MNGISELPTSETDALKHFGWKEESPGAGRFTRGRGQRPGVMQRFGGSSGWQRWRLEGKGIAAVKPSEVFVQNHLLAGPVKFVRDGSRTVVCRADLPVDLQNAPAEFDFVSGRSSSPLTSWVEAITAVVSEKPCAPSEPLPVDETLADLQHWGWVASADGERVQVTVPFIDMYREVTIQRSGPAGTRISCDLVNLSGWPQVSRRAALEIGHAANNRLQLVRYSAADQAGHQLAAEVFLSAPMRLPGAWLQAALEAVRAAIAISSRELAALEDVRLAKQVLATLLAQ